MTLAQALDYVRNRHNAVGSSYWSDAEIYALISGRAQTIAATVGLMDETDTATPTVSGTQAYNWPTDAIILERVLWDGKALQEITHREWEEEKLSGTTTSGDPESYVNWDRQVLLVPVPTIAETLTFYYQKTHPYLTAGTDTINLPATLHFALLDGVLSDMYAKSKNAQMATFYENKWREHMGSTFPMHRIRLRHGSRGKVVIDGDSGIQGGHGNF